MRTVVAILALAGSAACDEALVTPTSELRSLVAAESRWEASKPAAYEFTFLRTCFCVLVTPIRVTVRDGVVTSARIISSGEELTGEQLSWMPTIDDVFTELGRVLALPPARFSARYDAARGFPSEASVDQILNMADDEFDLRLSDFAELP